MPKIRHPHGFPKQFEVSGYKLDCSGCPQERRGGRGPMLPMGLYLVAACGLDEPGSIYTEGSEAHDHERPMTTNAGPAELEREKR